VSLIFTGIGTLLSVRVCLDIALRYFDTPIPQAVQAVSASQGAMIDLFERIENFFKRLEAYIGLTRTAGMMEIIVNVTAEVLIILSLATREIKQGRMSESVPSHGQPISIYYSPEKFLKKLIGRSEIKDALQRLDNLAQEESRMAAVQGLKGVHGVSNKLGQLQQAATD
jgi:hypothetical protein